MKVKHLQDCKEGYFKHMTEALFMSLISFAATIVVVIHSIFPFLFTTTASSMLKYIIKRSDKRQNIIE